MFFSWLAAQSYSIEVAIGVLFMVVIAPVMLAGMAGLASWAEQPVVELLRMSGMFDLLEREKKTLWRLPHTDNANLLQNLRLPAFE